MRYRRSLAAVADVVYALYTYQSMSVMSMSNLMSTFEGTAAHVWLNDDAGGPGVWSCGGRVGVLVFARCFRMALLEDSGSTRAQRLPTAAPRGVPKWSRRAMVLVMSDLWP